MESSRSQKVCSVEGCGRRTMSRELCRTHYSRLLKIGSPGLADLEPVDDSCDVDGCDRVKVAQNLCSMHYRRKNKTGYVGAAETTRPPQGDVCIIEGCTNLSSKRNMCGMHYQRLRRYGDPGLAEKQRQAAQGLLCSVDGCENNVCARGFCPVHYNNWWRVLNGNGSKIIYDEAVAYYKNLHKRINRALGSAKLYKCVCGKRAVHWAYTHTCPDERQSAIGPYSLSYEHYIPLCQSCHKWLDFSVAQDKLNR